MAPEMMKSEPCNEKVDIWSFGIVLHELMTQEIPYKGIPSMAIMYGVGSGTLKLHVPKSVPQSAKLLFKLCFSKKPRNRPSFASIASHLTNLQAEVAEMSEDAWSMRKQVWQKEIREEAHRNQNVTPAEERNYEAEELARKRAHELRHAQDIREMYEKKHFRVDKMISKLLGMTEDMSAQEHDLKIWESRLIQKEKELESRERRLILQGTTEHRRSAPPANNTCRVQKHMVVRAGAKSIAGQVDVDQDFECQLPSANYAVVSMMQNDDDADSEVEAMSSRSSSDEEYYGPRRKQLPSCASDNSFIRSSTRHSVGLPPSTVRSPKNDRSSIPAFPSSQSDRNFQQTDVCPSCLYQFQRNSVARISGISADSGVCTSTLTLEDTGQRLHHYSDNPTHGSPLYRNVEGRWSDGRIQSRRKPRRQGSRDSPFTNASKKSSPTARIGSTGANEGVVHRSRDLHAMRSMSMIESVEVEVEVAEDEHGRLVVLDGVKPSPSYQEAINASNNPIPTNNRIAALRHEFSGDSRKTDEEIIAAAMCESSSTMVSSLERSLELAVGLSDGLSDKESTIRTLKKTHRRTASVRLFTPSNCPN